MKSLKNLGEVLNKREQQSIAGGWDTGYCRELFQTANCHHPHWVICGFHPPAPNGSCLR